MNNMMNNSFTSNTTVQHYYTEYFLPSPDQPQRNNNNNHLSMVSTEPIKKPRGRPKGSGSRGKSPKVIRKNKPKRASSSNLRAKYDIEGLFIEQRKNFSVVIHNSRRCVLNSRRTDPKVYNNLNDIKQHLEIDNKNMDDTRLFIPEPHEKIMTINKERLVLYNMRNCAIVEALPIEIDSAIQVPGFKLDESHGLQPVTFKCPKDTLLLSAIYEGNPNVISVEQASSVVVRREPQVAKVVIKKPVKQIDSIALLKRKPLHLTIRDVYDNLDFESFVHDIEQVNRNVHQVNVSHVLEQQQQLESYSEPQPQPQTNSEHTIEPARVQPQTESMPEIMFMEDPQLQADAVVEPEQTAIDDRSNDLLPMLSDFEIFFQSGYYFGHEELFM
jgi:hypothetical protein